MGGVGNNRNRRGKFDVAKATTVVVDPITQPQLDDIIPEVDWLEATHEYWESLTDHPTFKTMTRAQWFSAAMSLAVPFNDALLKMVNGQSVIRAVEVFTSNSKDFGLPPKALLGMNIELLTAEEMANRIAATRPPVAPALLPASKVYDGLRLDSAAGKQGA